MEQMAKYFQYMEAILAGAVYTDMLDAQLQDRNIGVLHIYGYEEVDIYIPNTKRDSKTRRRKCEIKFSTVRKRKKKGKKLLTFKINDNAFARTKTTRGSQYIGTIKSDRRRGS